MKKLFLIVTLLMTSLIITACDNIIADSAEGIVISSAENVRTIKEGETLQLTATVYPLTIDQIVVWSSSNETVATVNESGLVTAVAKGNVDIIATSSVTPEVSQKFSLVIEEAAEVEIAAESVTITADKTTCKVGEKINLSAVVAPQGANQSVTWSSADQTMATVSRGEVTALKEGTVVITVAVKNYPNITSTITLTFEKSDDPIVNLDWAQMPYSTHEDYMTADGDAPLKVKGVVTHVTPVTETVVSYFIQNGVDGYYVYAQNNISFPVELGKSYEVGGYKKYYRGLNEIVNVEHFVELTEACTYTENAIGELDPTSLDAMNPYHCSIVTGKAAFSNGSTNTKAYSFYAMVNGKSTTFRVDPSYITAEEFEAINQKVSGAVEGLEFTFKGVMTAFGYGKASPQILVLKATDLEFAELSPQIILEAAANSLKVSSSVPFKVNTITLPTAVEGNPDITVEWSTESDLIDLSTGAVTHPNAGTEVVLKATLTLGDEEYEAEFKVYIFEQDNNEYEVVTSLDLEECGETDSYGNSLTKPGYAAGVVSIGTPANEWLLQNALISGTSADKKDGKMSIRAQAGKDAEKTGRIEIKNAGEYNVVEFDTAIYGTNALGVKVRVEYSLDNGATWVAHDAVITIDHYTLETYRFKLPEGVKHVAIVVVENTGNRINFDNIKLMK